MRASALVLVASVLLALTASAISPARASVRFGLEGGINASKATFSWPDDPRGTPPDPAYRAAWSGGLTAELPVAPRASLVTGLRYLEYGERTSVSIVSVSGGGTFERHLVWRYLAVPVLARVRPFPVRGPFLTAGFEVGYLLDAWSQDRAEVAAGPFAPERSAAARPSSTIYESFGTFFGDPHGMYAHGNGTLVAGAGWELPPGGHAARIEGRYEHGLSDIATANGAERYTRAFELLVGVSW
jgi:hypothetical protein